MHLLRNLTAVAGFLVLVGGAIAQDSDWYRHREERFRGENWRMHMFAEVKEDLDHVHTSIFHGRDELRIVKTKTELNELQSDLEAHRYTQAKLDDVIGSLQRVVADNRMPPQDREMLNDDLRRLRDYREHHENWGH
jgi:hypothetical protein